MQCSPCNQWHCSGVVPCDALTVSSPASYLPHPSSPPSLQVLCLAGRAVNIFPLSALVNRFRSVRITFENQFIMWFSGKTHSLQQCTCVHLCMPKHRFPSLSVVAAECRAARCSGICPCSDAGRLGGDNLQDTSHYHPHHCAVHHCGAGGLHPANTEGTAYVVAFVCSYLWSGIHCAMNDKQECFLTSVPIA